jgi:hypothetical protein
VAVRADVAQEAVQKTVERSLSRRDSFDPTAGPPADGFTAFSNSSCRKSVGLFASNRSNSHPTRPIGIPLRRLSRTSITVIWTN